MKRSAKIAVYAALALIAVGVLLYSRSGPRGGKSPAEEQKPSQRQGQNAPRRIPVDVYIADFMTMAEGFHALGTMLPNESLDIASEVAGKVEKISFDEGSMVKKGQVLVKINDDDLQSQLKRAIFQRDLIKEKLERNRILLDKDAISREAFDQIETDHKVIEADIQLLEVRIGKTSIKAPFDGMVGFRYVSLGSYIQPGTKIAHMVDISRLKVEFSLPEKYYSEALKGSTISFSTENNPHPRTARIYAVDPTVDVMTRTVIMRALYDNAGMKIIPGMFANVVVGQKSGSTLQVPTEAIVPDADQKAVWIVSDGKAHARNVITGVRSENMIEVRSGLQQGDSVVITGLMQIKEGSPLLINN